jgi:hypothetical protein
MVESSELRVESRHNQSEVNRYREGVSGVRGARFRWKDAKIGLFVLVLNGTLLFAAPAQRPRTSCDTPREHTLYSWRASVFSQVSSQTLKSPDGQKLLTMERMPETDNNEEGSIRYTVVAGKQRFSAELPGFDAEVSWSPDSSAFAVTETEGGGGIGYDAYVFRIGERGLQQMNLSPLAAKAFGSPVKCEVPVDPNVGFVGWLDPHRVLVAAEVVPVSICPCRGMFAAYEISLPDAVIIRRYSQKETKRKFWNLLGCELRDADDGCASRLQGMHRPR